jgi:predicted enzyme related to lactoylglutathione lyase
METTMYDHIGLRVADLDAATRFYTAVLAPLGYVLCSSGPWLCRLRAEGRAGAVAAPEQGAQSRRRAYRLSRWRS